MNYNQSNPITKISSQSIHNPITRTTITSVESELILNMIVRVGIVLWLK